MANVLLRPILRHEASKVGSLLKGNLTKNFVAFRAHTRLASTNCSEPGRVISAHLIGFGKRPELARLTKHDVVASASRHLSLGLVKRSLAAKERKANEHLDDPSVQADYYAALLAHKYPEVVVKRYENSSVASNAECESLYLGALELLGETQKAAAVRNSGVQDQGAPAAFSGETATAGVKRPSITSSGLKSDPIHVVLQDSKGSLFFRYVRLLVMLGVSFYALIVLVAVASETSGILKGPPQAKHDTSMSQPTVKFTDVHGVDEARADLEEIVAFLRDPTKYTGLGGRLPKGVLLTGPPGTGKTLLARAVAGEAGVPFFFMSGSEFDEMYVGVGAKRVRELFAAAKAKAPSIVFIDELDAIGARRNSRDQAYVKQTLNQLLVDLDGFSQTTGVIFIAATNFPELLDPALTRPGRFDKIVNVDLPDVRGRIAILKHHMKNVETASDVDVESVARGTPGFSGADLQNLVNQAAIHASQVNAHQVDTNHFEWAKDKILMGAEKKSMVLTDSTKRLTAFHEAGHALIAMYTPGATSLYKATILPRGRALGVTFQLPEMDKYDQTKKELLAQIDVCMGGKAAEEFINGPENVTSGCASDLKKATQIARQMVTSYGMSDKVGPVELSDKWQEWSAKTRELAESEIRDLLQKSEERAKKLLYERSKELNRLAEALVEYETLDKADIERVVNGEKPVKAKKAALSESVASIIKGTRPIPAARDRTPPAL
ncbi:peptidase family M41-domain-containing protein [Lipomyces orientalis]|uniref:Peptidase family M41-domain-containing protein n=1 Tax=Lipomyces orientalis TaxID=1233043 RepID=A0ACC3TM63_9ASCO